MLEKAELALGTLVLLAGIGLCGFVLVMASRRYRRDSDIKALLISLVAAIVALAAGLLTMLIVFFHAGVVIGNFPGVTGSRAVFAYISSFLSVPLGLAWGWGLSFVRGPVDATGQRASDFAVRGLAWCMLAATALPTVDLVARLILYGHDKSILSTEIAAGAVFLGVMTLSAAGITLNIRNLNTWLALRQAGIGFGCSIMLAVGVIIAAAAVKSLFLGSARLLEAWNVLIFFYPFYLGGSLALAAVLFFYGGRTFARTWPRLSLA